MCISLIPHSFNPPLRIYTPAARNEWFTWRGSLPPSESFATIHHSPASVPLISLCCVTLETPLRSRTCFLFFFHAPSLALFLSYIQYWLFMLFNVAERARGLRTGEKRSSWHTYAPVVNSSSQHSSKYTNLLLFPSPFFFPLPLFVPFLFYIWELLWTLAPCAAPLQRSPYGRLRCSNALAKCLHNNPPRLHQRGGSGVEWSDLRGGLEASGGSNSHLWAE